eukprot:4198093-Amphidinium_carterae.1
MLDTDNPATVSDSEIVPQHNVSKDGCAMYGSPSTSTRVRREGKVARAMLKLGGKTNYYSCHHLKLNLLQWQPVGSPPERVLGSMKLWREGF